MTKINKNTSLPKVWRTSNLRVTLFSKDQFTDDAKSYWPNIPEIELEKESRQTKTTEVIFEGSYKDKRISMIFLPLRIDLVISAPLEPSQLGESFPSIGDLDDTIDDFNQFVNGWIKQISIRSIKRIAFGAEIIRQVSSVEEGYKQISEYLPFSITKEKYSDFRLQLNKVEKSDVFEDLSINQLTIWDVVTTTLNITSVTDPELTYTSPTLYFCHAILDINTAIEYKETFSEAQSIQIFQELTTRGKNISKDGVK